jgi:hypothetical protein
MGWTFSRKATKQSIIDERLAPWDVTTRAEDERWTGKAAGTRSQSVVLAFRCVGNSLWTVRETTVTTPEGKVTTEKWIGLNLLEADCNGWGWKSMDEAMGPYDWTCPVEFLDMAPQPEGEFCAKWRSAIRERSNKQMVLFVPLEKFAIGMESAAAEA